MNPIFIVGAPRSGTSLTAGALSALGLDFGKTQPGDRNNRRGYFEHTGIRDNVVKPLIKAQGGDPIGQRYFAKKQGSCDPAKLRASVLMRLNGAQAYKDPKLCLVWQQWIQAFPGARYVIVLRDADRIAESCLRTSFLTAYRTKQEWRRWAMHYISGLMEFRARTNSIDVWPDDDPKTFKPVAEFCGLEWNAASVADFVDPKLWNRKT